MSRKEESAGKIARAFKSVVSDGAGLPPFR